MSEHHQAAVSVQFAREFLSFPPDTVTLGPYHSVWLMGDALWAREEPFDVSLPYDHPRNKGIILATRRSDSPHERRDGVPCGVAWTVNGVEGIEFPLVTIGPVKPTS